LKGKACLTCHCPTAHRRLAVSRGVANTRIIILAMRLLHITPHLVLGSTEPTLTKERQRPLLRVERHFHTLYIIYPRRSIIHILIPLVVTYSFAFCPSGLLLPRHIIPNMSGGSVYWLDVFLASHLLGLKPRRWALAVRLPLDLRFWKSWN
jgi:hypothetical protein